ncbi:MAG: ATP-dependent DNA helicase [Thermoplasmatota archaeon]
MITSDIFPYDIRPIQREMVAAVEKAMKSGGHVVIEAGTGSGKTVASLVPALVRAYSEGKRILYLTRTNSQQRQVVREFRAIKGRIGGRRIEEGDPKVPAPDVVEEVIGELNRELKGEPSRDDRTNDPVVNTRSPWEGGLSNSVCIAIQGRNNMCPLTSEDPEFITGTPEELSKMCSERKRNTNSRACGKPTGGKECSYYSAFLLDEGMEVRKWARSEAPTAEEIISKSLSIGVCPYEVTKLMASEAVAVTAPYIFFLSPFIRRRLLDWMECSVEELIIIVDEAHNLAGFARDLASMTLSSFTLRMAQSEVESHGDHDIGEGRTIRGFLEVLNEAMEELAGEYMIDEDGLVPPTSLTEAMMVIFGTNSYRIGAMASEMLQIGAAIQDQKKAQGRLPRSYIHRVAQFYLTWCELEFEKYTPLIVKGRRQGEIILEAFAMDPSPFTSAFRDAHCTVHISGTLSPMDEYRDTISLPGDTSLIRLPPPFPLENRMVVYDTDLSTNYEVMMKDPEIRTRYRTALQCILSVSGSRNTAVFFPSFDLMEAILGSMELEDGTFLSHSLSTGREMFIERKGLPQADVMELAENFRTSRGGVLTSVIGGRLSEGVDFPGDSLEMVVVVGIPYPRPNARQRALSSFYDIKFGKGWEYTVHAPAARKLQQAIGRMIRSESERGFAYILDKRAFHFRTELPDLREGRASLQDMTEFFSGGETGRPHYS